jgi:hypothetical protein
VPEKLKDGRWSFFGKTELSTLRSDVFWTPRVTLYFSSFQTALRADQRDLRSSVVREFTVHSGNNFTTLLSLVMMVYEGQQDDGAKFEQPGDHLPPRNQRS